MSSDHLSVSIVTPSYNQSQFIEETLQCIRDQTYGDIEHVVVDGGSDDGTIEILEDYESQYDLNWTSESDDGQSDAINTGFERAEGDVIGWLNSDDLYFRDDTVEKVVEALAANSGANIAFGDAIFVNADGKPLFVRKRKFWHDGRFRRGWTIPQPAIFFRQDVLSEHHLDQSLEYVMDQEFWLRIFDKYESVYLDDIVAVDRLHENAKRVAADSNKFRNELEAVLKQHGQEFNWRYDVLCRVDTIYLALMRLWGTIDALRISNDQTINVDMDWESRRGLLNQFLPR